MRPCLALQREIFFVPLKERREDESHRLSIKPVLASIAQKLRGLLIQRSVQ